MSPTDSVSGASFSFNMPTIMTFCLSFYLLVCQFSFFFFWSIRSLGQLVLVGGENYLHTCLFLKLGWVGSESGVPTGAKLALKLPKLANKHCLNGEREQEERERERERDKTTRKTEKKEKESKKRHKKCREKK